MSLQARPARPVDRDNPPDRVSRPNPGEAGPGKQQQVIWLRPATPASLAQATAPGASARAILAEIQRCAERLVANGATGSVDLRVLRAIPGERAILADLLGRGEVSAVVQSIGRSEVQETAIPCVWWVRHFDDEARVVGETIEVAEIPELLVGDRDATVIAFESLNARLNSGA